jgi:hypothetical protein
MKSFGGKCLHEIDSTGKIKNPYQEVIEIVGTKK